VTAQGLRARAGRNRTGSRHTNQKRTATRLRPTSARRTGALKHAHSCCTGSRAPAHGSPSRPANRRRRRPSSAEASPAPRRTISGRRDGTKSATRAHRKQAHDNTGVEERQLAFADTPRSASSAGAGRPTNGGGGRRDLTPARHHSQPLAVARFRAAGESRALERGFSGAPGVEHVRHG
jgi:hypothetical protein